MIGAASAPASSGNLGPGFDVLALALELRCHVEAEPAPTWEIHENGACYVPDDDDMVLGAAVAAVGRPMRLRIDNHIPRSRGLGSSSAVTAATAAASMRAVGRTPDPVRLFEIVTDLEGHGDNAAAAVYGGLVAVSGSLIRHLVVHPDLRIVVGIPDAKLRTDKARAVLTDNVDRWAAARNLARVVFLLEGLKNADPEALRAAGGDELHEVPRHDLSPVTASLMDAALDAGAFHAAWSGAGPAAIAFTSAAAGGDVEAAFGKVLNGAGEVRCLDIATDGIL